MVSKVHIWVPELAATGGIQAFSRFLLRAAAETLPGAEIRVFSKNDLPGLGGAIPRYQPPIKFEGKGHRPRGLRTVFFAVGLVHGALRDRPDLILSTHINFTPAARLVQRLSGIPYYVVAHGIEAWGSRNGRVRAGLHSADCVLAVSRYTREVVLSDQHLAASRVKLLPNTFADGQFVPGPKPGFLLERFGLTPVQPVILTIARLAGAERNKGYDRVLRALPEIRRRVPGTHYILGGSGPDRARVEALVRGLGLEKYVTFAGFVPDSELCAFYNLGDVFAMPGKGEGFGIVYLEALACGKPVVAGNKDGSRDALLDGELGVLVDPDDAGAIAEQIIQILQGRHPLAVLKQPEELRRRVVEAYGYASFVRRVREILGEQVKG